MEVDVYAGILFLDAYMYLIYLVAWWFSSRSAYLFVSTTVLRLVMRWDLVVLSERSWFLGRICSR